MKTDSRESSPRGITARWGRRIAAVGALVIVIGAWGCATPPRGTRACEGGAPGTGRPTAATLATTEGTAPRRFAWVTGVKPDKVAYYKQLHAHPWPAVNRMIRECHIRNFSIHLKEIDGRPYLFAYLEYTGTDFDADMKRMAADPETQRWWKETDPCQAPLPDAAAQGKIWSDMEEVYFLP